MVMQFSTNCSPNISFWQCSDVAEIRQGITPRKTISHMYPYSGIWSAWETLSFCSCQAR